MKVVIFTNNDSPASNYSLNKIVKNKDIKVVGIFNVKNFRFSKFKKHTAKALLLGGVLVSIRLLALLASLKLVAFLKKNFYKKRRIFTAEEIAKENNIPYYYINSVNSKEGIRIIKNLKPELIISNFFDQIIKKNVLDIPKKGVINIHPGILPNYKGLYPYFWKLVNKEKISGVTIHTMTEIIDEGEILAVKTFKIKKSDDVISLSIKSGKAGVKILEKVLRKIKKGQTKGFHVKIINKLKNKGYFGLPTKEAVQKLYTRNRAIWSFRKLFKYF